MNYHKLNFKSLNQFLMSNGFWMRETRLRINKIHNCIVCLQITNNENIITWVEPMSATIQEICLAQTYIEEIKEKTNNV